MSKHLGYRFTGHKPTSDEETFLLGLPPTWLLSLPLCIIAHCVQNNEPTFTPISSDADKEWQLSTVAYQTVETISEKRMWQLVFAPARGVPKSVPEGAQELARCPVDQRDRTTTCKAFISDLCPQLRTLVPQSCARKLH